MDFENEDQSLLDQATDNGLQKKLKISYTREFLLSFSGLDICKEFPSGFDRSLLSEFEDASLDRQRSTGALSTHSFRRNEYSSSPPTRGDMNNFSRGTHGKWDSRSSGRSDRDSDSQSEWDSDSGKRFGNQSRRSLQGPEHDGLLGSGSFPRPAGYAPGSSAPKFRANDNYQPNRSNEPYHPPRPYKAPHSRRETNDSFNDETFGSLECTNEDRAEEERKRRASFELMRKEQTEKLKLNPEKNKADFDLSSLIDDDSKRLVTRSNDSVEEPPLTIAAISNDEKSSSLPHASARPLVPPGFASSMLERNMGSKISSNTHAAEAGQPEPGDTRGSYVFSINPENKEGKLPTKQVDSNQQNLQSADINVSINNEKEDILNLSYAADIPNIKIGMSDQLRKRSALSEALEASDDSKFIQLNAEVKGKEAVGAAFNPESSESILYKLFGNASTLTSGISSSIVEQPDPKADETWSPHAFQSSKFAHWFAEEEKKSMDDLTPRPNDLLSLIVGGEKGGLQVSDVETTHHVAPNFTYRNPEPAGEHVATNVTHTAIVNSELSHESDKPEILPAVLTCEDLEQSILSQVSENGSSSQQRLKDKDFGAKTGQSTSIDGHASEHLLSLLQKGSLHKDMELSSVLDSTDMVHNTEGVTTGKFLDNPKEANADASNPSKTLTLETLFGSAFMKELQSVGAPLSVQRGSIGSSGADFSDSQFPFPTSENSHPPTGELSRNRHGSGVFPSEQIHQPKSNRFEEQWLGYGDSHGDVNPSILHSGIPKASGFNRSHDIRLPEEDNLISAGDPLQSFLSVGSSAKTELSQESPVEITRKLAALNSAFRDERHMMRNQEGQAYPRGPYDIREPGIPYQNLNPHRPSQLQPHQLNHIGPMFNQLDSHSPHVSSYMKHATSEGMVHHGSPTNRQFPGNMLHPPFHQPSSVVTGFDPPAHHPLLQQMHMQGNLPPPHLLRGFPRGATMPPHPSNPMAGIMQEPNPMQGFPFSGQQHPSLGGPGMQLQAPAVAGGRNHPEALQRLFEMELRSNSKPIHPSGHNQGIHGHELDLGFGYR